MTSRIYWMCARDLQRVHEIEQVSFEFPWSFQQLRKYLNQRNTSGRVAVMHGDIVGYAIAENRFEQVEIVNLAVHPAYLREGIATELLSYYVAKTDGGCFRGMHTLVRESNLTAQLFFRAAGFRACDTLRDYYDDTTDDAYEMRYMPPVPSNQRSTL